LTTGEKGVESLGLPGAEKRGQRHFGSTAAGRACTATDFPLCDQVPQASFRRIVVWGNQWLSHEDEELRQEAYNPPTELALYGQRVVHEGTAERQQLFLQAVLLLAANPGIRVGDQASVIIDGPDRYSPLGKADVLGIELAQVVDIPQQVGPAALVQPRVMIIGRVEVADQHPAEVLTEHFVHHAFAPAPPYKVALRGGAEAQT